jgi:hypothetical protein
MVIYCCECPIRDFCIPLRYTGGHILDDGTMDEWDRDKCPLYRLLRAMHDAE